MNLKSWLTGAKNKLEKSGIGSARLDSLILLEDEFKKDRAWILAHPETEISKSKLKRLYAKLHRREKHVPMAHIRGFSEFYGRKFKINKHVLEPRPESETMIELLKQLVKRESLVVSRKNDKRITKNGPRIADVGTGSGALGITAALELHILDVDLYDIDASALAVAKHNVHLHELHLKTYKRDLLNRPLRSYDIILANLPYVPNSWKINKAAAMESKIAIFGGPDGLDLYRRLFNQLSQPPGTTLIEVNQPKTGSQGRTLRWGSWPKYVFTESMPPQHRQLAKIALDAGFKELKSQDFIQVFRKGSSF